MSRTPPAAEEPEIPINLNFPVRKLTTAQGANRARNAGLKSAKTDLVLFLDSDCWPVSTDFLKKYIEFFKEDSELCVAGGPYQLQAQADALSRAYHELQIRWIQEGLRDTALNAFNLLGGNLLVRRSQLRDMCFDENIIFGGTEREFLQRISQQRKKVQFFPRQSVIHDSSMSLRSFLKKAYAQGRGTKYITDKLGPHVNTKRFLRISMPPKNLFFYMQLYRWSFDIGQGETWWRHLLNRFHEGLNKFLTFLQNLKSYRIKDPRD